MGKRFNAVERTDNARFRIICEAIKAPDRKIAAYLNCSTGTVRAWRVSSVPAAIMPKMEQWYDAARPLIAFELKNGISDTDDSTATSIEEYLRDK
jgi:hypothetical protein